MLEMVVHLLGLALRSADLRLLRTLTRFLWEEGCVHLGCSRLLGVAIFGTIELVDALV